MSSSEYSVAADDNVLDLMSNGTCVMSSEMNATSGVNEQSVLVPKNDLVLAF
jgi:hypothetical protein